MNEQRDSTIHPFGFVRVAAASPRLHLANPPENLKTVAEIARSAHEQGVNLLVFPELSLTGYTCGDLFGQSTLLEAAWDALLRLAEASEDWQEMVLFVGLPVRFEGQVFNCAAVVAAGEIVGLVPKTHLPTYNEFYEQRHFSSGRDLRGKTLNVSDREIPFGIDLIFEFSQQPVCRVGVEICEDLWVPNPPSSSLAQNGANTIVNLSASNAVIGKAPFRRTLVAAQSGRCLATYIYAAAGVWESTTDLVFDGDCLIYESGACLAMSKRFSRDNELIVADTDLAKVEADRQKFKTFAEGKTGNDRLISPGAVFGAHQKVMGFHAKKSGGAHLVQEPGKLKRFIDAHPFVPTESATLAERCEEIFHTQVAGLGSRVACGKFPRLTIGVSGGLDSTLALLVCTKTADLLGIERSRIDGVTMPGFGTTGRTLQNAEALMEQLGISCTKIDIRAHSFEQMRTLGHRPFGIDLNGINVDAFVAALGQLKGDRLDDLVFENVQARARTSFLMNRGFVVGTGDLSEAALGWCTYNADHMSMYNPNASIPKTLVRFLVKWVAEHEFRGKTRETLLDICKTPISPELLPVRGDGSLIQETEKSVGPYELHDFFLYHMIRYGAPPSKILYLATQAAFDRNYAVDEIQHWLEIFLKRFFSQQFKRSCMPDGPKVGTISLSPRGDWRMPSDAQSEVWLSNLQKKI